MSTTTLLAISAGPLLFAFESFEDWCHRGPTIYRDHAVRSGETIARDQLGRLVDCGGDFMAARVDSAYPVEVYRRRADRG